MADNGTPRQPFKNVGLRIPKDLAELVEKEAARVGIEPADWYRAAVHRQLTEFRLTKSEASKYKRPRTRRGQREYAAQPWRRDRTAVS